MPSDTNMVKAGASQTLQAHLALVVGSSSKWLMGKNRSS